MRLATANLQVFELGAFNHGCQVFHGLRIGRRGMAGHTLCFVLPVKFGKSAVNSVFGSGFRLSLALAFCLSLIAPASLAATGDPAVGARKALHAAQMRSAKPPP